MTPLVRKGLTNMCPIEIECPTEIVCLYLFKLNNVILYGIANRFGLYILHVGSVSRSSGSVFGSLVVRRSPAARRRKPQRVPALQLRPT